MRGTMAQIHAMVFEYTQFEGVSMVKSDRKSIDSFVQNHMPAPHMWPKFINTNLETKNKPFNCAAELLDNAITEGYGDKVALYSPKSSWTYQELLNKANQIAHILKDDLGLVAGNRVLLRSTNNPMLIACWLAVIKAGGIVITTIAMLRAKEIITCASQSRASLALCDYRLKDDMESAASELSNMSHILYFNGPGELEARMKTKPTSFDNHPAHQSDIAMIGFTSGTTGLPKAALHSHHAIIAVCQAFSQQVLKPTPQDIFSGTPPLGFVYGLGGLLLFPLYVRAATVLLEDVSTESLITAIDKFGVSIFFTAPTAYKALLQNFDAQKLSSLKKCMSAGEALPDYVTRAWLDKTGIRLIDGIGSTEMLNNFICIQHPDDPIGSLGKAVPGYEARIVNKQGDPVPVGEVGFLAVRGPVGCRYLDDERQTKYVINGWNITGDTARIDKDGYFWYQARNDGMIISSGYNIASPEVEKTVSQHPAVADCAVIGIPDPVRGEIVRAYIVLKKGYKPDTRLIKNIQNFTKKHSAPYKYPRSIAFIDVLPRTPSGKIQHFMLSKIAEKEAGQGGLGISVSGNL